MAGNTTWSSTRRSGWTQQHRRRIKELRQLIFGDRPIRPVKRVVPGWGFTGTPLEIPPLAAAANTVQPQFPGGEQRVDQPPAQISGPIGGLMYLGPCCPTCKQPVQLSMVTDYNQILSWPEGETQPCPRCQPDQHQVRLEYLSLAASQNERLLKSKRLREFMNDARQYFYDRIAPKGHLLEQRAWYRACSPASEDEARVFSIVEQFGTSSSPWCLVLSGSAGAGKTRLLAAKWRHYVRHRGQRNIWVTEQEMHQEWIEAFKNHQDADEAMQVYIDTPVLFIDDFGSIRKTEKWPDQMAYILYERERMQKVTLMTTNLNGGQVSERYHERLADRLKIGVLKMVGESHRPMSSW